MWTDVWFIGTLAGGLFAAPLAAEAQQAGKVYRMGVLFEGTPSAGHGRARAAKQPAPSIPPWTPRAGLRGRTKTARALGLTMRQSLLLRANQVIE